jgi:hypothetical protein
MNKQQTKVLYSMTLQLSADLWDILNIILPISTQQNILTYSHDMLLQFLSHWTNNIRFFWATLSVQVSLQKPQLLHPQILAVRVCLLIFVNPAISLVIQLMLFITRR